MRKRIIAAILTVAMSVGLCTGCGKETTTHGGENSDKQTSESSSAEVASTQEASSDDETSGWLVDEETELKVMFYSDYDIDENAWVFQKIKERTGIVIEPICYSAEVAMEKL